MADDGVEVVRGDLEDPASLEAAVHGVCGVYSVQDFSSVGAKREVTQGKNSADVAKKAGVEHFVYSSVGGAERNTGIGSTGYENGIAKSNFRLSNSGFTTKAGTSACDVCRRLKDEFWEFNFAWEESWI
jgi:uncharacterized protein YbjT (DUF2867 family)